MVIPSAAMVEKMLMKMVFFIGSLIASTTFTLKKRE